MVTIIALSNTSAVTFLVTLEASMRKSAVGANFVNRAFLLLLPMALVAAIVSVRAAGGYGSGSVAISNGSPTVQNFDPLANSATTSTALPAGWYLTELGTGGAADGAYVVGTGSSN